ncbi:ferredoxin [Palleronia caenipelagi]|uniref:Ferredoxin n=1 Tax=Palleronia caenipelagi TaxID=2489174 RepID=A0A547Q093_9RHOB|nr:ferredoxin [Palleronia caenipelagi]TRD19822.1 ferredoxin [Palleronia caenipelagi]
MTAPNVTEALAPHGLRPLGTCTVTSADELPGLGSLVLVGPEEPGFWDVFSASPEASDGVSDPLDRWSQRVLDDVADELGATALYPFGTPARPFIGWALRTGAAFASPVQLLVHAEAGLHVSYRGALGFTETLSPEAPTPSPCTPCPRPCLTACPVNAMGPDGYDTARCRAHLAESNTCRDGCLVRRACPVGPDRAAAQGRFHMEAFIR